jgi:GDP/UDP-N,N'-diacetylbacillosamine 2-epimerase (hydrolysing)
LKLKIHIISGGRADYDLLKNLFFSLKKANKFFNTKFIVTGSHLSNKHGKTVNQIFNDKIKIFKKIDIKINSDTPNGISKNISLGIKAFSNFFTKNRPDLIIILGDRYEIFSASIAAHVMSIPIAHIQGGESTFGAIDDAIRHSITKMANFHFVANKIYKKRVIQLGENPKKVFNVGGLGVDNIKIKKLFKKKEIEKKLNVKILKKNLLVTFHPETNSVTKQTIDPMLEVLKKIKNTNFFFTIPNADTYNSKILKEIKNFQKKNSNCKVFNSLGIKMYHSLVLICDAVIGNSSSGIAEVPYFKKPTINIGSRQDGRIRVKSIIDIKMNKKDINNAIKKIYSNNFISKIQNVKSPYGRGGASSKIVNYLKKIKINKLKNIKYKVFFDLNS